MAEPFLAEIRIFSFNFAPKGWAMCNGQLLPINQNQALFSLLGTTYGGDGRVNFGLPDNRDRVPISVGGSGAHVLGERGGEAAHTLTQAELPTHTHTLSGLSDAGDVPIATGAMLASAAGLYGPVQAQNLTSLVPATVTSVGGSQAHQNMQPYLTLNFCIALQGIFPSPN